MPFSFQAAFPIGTMCASKDVHHSSTPAVLADRFSGATFFRAQKPVRLFIRGSVTQIHRQENEERVFFFDYSVLTGKSWLTSFTSLARRQSYFFLLRLTP